MPRRPKLSLIASLLIALCIGAGGGALLYAGISNDNGKTWREGFDRIRGATLDRVLFVDFERGWVTGETVQPRQRRTVTGMVAASTRAGSGSSRSNGEVKHQLSERMAWTRAANAASVGAAALGAPALDWGVMLFSASHAGLSTSGPSVSRPTSNNRCTSSVQMTRKRRSAISSANVPDGAGELGTILATTANRCHSATCCAAP